MQIIFPPENDFLDGTMGLRLTIHVPSRAVPNSAAHLECNYELENEEQIDTVRLLKDDTEFYHFAPDEIDHISVVPGINENVSLFFEIWSFHFHIHEDILSFRS